MNLRSQLVLLTLVVLLPVSILAAVLGAFLIEQQRDTFRRGTEERVRALLTAIDTELNGSINVLRALASVRSLDEPDFEYFRRSADQVLREQDNWATINLALPDGQQIMNLRVPEGAALPRIPVEDGSVARLSQTLMPAVGDMVFGPSTRRWDFAVRVPVARDGMLKYVLSAVVDPESIDWLVRAQGLPQDWDGMVVDGNGRIVARTAEPESIGQHAAADLRKALGEASSGWFLATNPEGVAKYRAYRRSEATGWTFAMAIPASVADATPMRAIWIFGFSLAGAILLAFLLARLAGARISAPISALASATERLARGENVEVEGVARLAELRTLETALRNAAGAQTALRRAEEHTRSIVDHVVDGIITIDERGAVESFNRAAEKLFGYTAAEMIGHNIKKLMPEPYRAEHDDYVGRYVRTGHAKIIGSGREVVGRRKDGSTFPMELAVSEFRIGARRFLTGIVRDITERKRIEQELRSSEERLRMALAAGRMGNWEWDLGANTVTWSADLEAIHGLAPGTFAGTFDAYEEDIHPEDREHVRQAIAETLQRDEHQLEYRIVRPDGAVRWVEGRGKVFRDSTGAPLRLVGVCTDVTERKEAELKLERERERLSLALAAGAMGVYEWDPVEGAAWWSPELYSIYGVKPESFSPAEGVNLVHPEDLEKVMEMQRAIEEHRPWIQEYRIIRPDGEVRWVAGRGNTGYKDGGGRRFHGVIADITERKRVEEALREADRHKDEFLAMLSHELRNPLAALSTAAHVVRASKAKDPTLAGAQGVIERQTQHIVRLIEDLLDTTRIRLGKLSLKREALNLGDLVFEVTESKRAAGVLSGRAAVNVEASPVWVHGDRARLEQLYSNLLDNALKFTPKTGHIHVSVQQRGAEAILCVADDGPGIAPEVLPKVFDLFVQGEQNLDRPQGGLGLGLALVRRLADMHGGNVSAASDGIGHGSSFTVSLPAIEGPSGPSTGAAALTPAGRKPLRILIVEDNQDARQMLCAALAMQGHDVREAASGAAGVAAAAETNPDVVLLDIGLPDTDGYDVARRLRAGPGGRSMTLVAVSGYGPADNGERDDAAGFDAHVVKPASADQIAEVIARLVTESRRTAT